MEMTNDSEDPHRTRSHDCRERPEPDSHTTRARTDVRGRTDEPRSARREPRSGGPICGRAQSSPAPSPRERRPSVPPARRRARWIPDCSGAAQGGAMSVSEIVETIGQLRDGEARLVDTVAREKES